MKETEYILCAAIFYDDEIEHLHQPANIETGVVYCGWRHGSIFPQIAVLEGNKILGASSHQGFLTSKNRFVNREEVAKIALKANQIHKELDRLHSEDLY